MHLKKGFAHNLQKAKEAGAETIQIFSGNPRSWSSPTTSPEEVKERSLLMKKEGIFPLVIHTTYLINLASVHPEFYRKSTRLLHETLHHASLYPEPYVVLHVGNHGGAGTMEGIKKAVRSLEEELSRGWAPGVILLLENTAGGGHHLGGDIRELGLILHHFQGAPIGFCLDTAHAWAAGYDLSGAEGVEQLLTEIDREIGLERLHLIHANDTKVERGSKHDRHAHIGEGRIGLEGFRSLLRYDWPDDFPMILETPEIGTAKDKQNISALRNCMSRGCKHQSINQQYDFFEGE